MSAPDDPGDPAAYVRFATIATVLPCRNNPPLSADFVAKVVGDFCEE